MRTDSSVDYQPTQPERPRRRSWCISPPEFWRLYLTLVAGILGALVWSCFA